MTKTVGSICSGIGVEKLAWHDLGFEHTFFTEIEPFASAVLAHRHPEVKNLGDFTQANPEPGSADILVGGTPCQSNSIAGPRTGLDDPRGGLAIDFCRLGARLGSRWLVWENVPGVLSVNQGRDFGAIIGEMAKLGYGVCWRVLDAQFIRVDEHGRAVPQRRRRVFLVGYLGDWRRAAAVLFDTESLSRNPPPRRGSQASVAGTLDARTRGGGFPGSDGACSGHVIATDVSQTLFSSTGGVSSGYHPIVAEVAPTLEKSQMPGIAFMPDVACTVMTQTRRVSQSWNDTLVGRRYAVRRLMPIECERLQGLPDDYTLVPYRGGLAADGPRYQVIGNGMARNVMRWIGLRIKMVDELF